MTNKLRLENQKFLLDGDAPYMLIVPCMTLKEANEWRGEGYKAVVLAGLPNLTCSVPDAYDNYDTTRRPAYVSSKVRMATDAFRERYAATHRMAPEQEKLMLEKARIGLQEAVLGLAHYAKQMASDAEKGLLRGMQKKTIETLRKL